ncbi:MAG: hypothetical protein R3C39_11765 [Dehalococcoidia bacterium]
MSHEIALVVVAVFLASAVEAVEALTIVLAVALTNGWRTAFLGTALASVALTVVVLALGPALVQVIPIEGLQTLIGVLLLVFGLQWLRKAIMRAAGVKAKHDEAAIFEEEVALLRGSAATPSTTDIDWTGFVVAFKGVFLEGLEVAFIVLTFAANRENALGWSALGAALAFALVAVVGLVVHRPLTRVPENTIKFTVGLMLVAFGTFWGGEGIGVEWTLGDWTILVLVGLYTAVAWLLITYLKRGATSVPALSPEATL